MKIDIEAEAERIARKVLKVSGPEHDPYVACLRSKVGTLYDVGKWQIAVEVGRTVLEEFVPRKREEPVS
jgi:hypothetical protein